MRGGDAAGGFADAIARLRAPAGGPVGLENPGSQSRKGLGGIARVALLVLCLILVFRPTGLFGEQRVIKL